MKKLGLLGLTVSLLGGCTLADMVDEGQITRRKLVGEWQCTASYPEYNSKTVGHLKLMNDGSLVNNSSIIEPIDKPFFVYDLSSTGTWKLDEQTHKLIIPQMLWMQWKRIQGINLTKKTYLIYTASVLINRTPLILRLLP